MPEILHTSGDIRRDGQKSSVVCRLEPLHAGDPAHKRRYPSGQPEKYGRAQAARFDSLEHLKLDIFRYLQMSIDVYKMSIDEFPL